MEIPSEGLPPTTEYLYIHTVYISVTILMSQGKRRSAYAVKAQIPHVGWLHYTVEDSNVKASLKREDGVEMLSLDHARLVGCQGTKGALIEGIEYRSKGRKHSIRDAQAWWCEAPPRRKPLVDHSARVRQAERMFDAETDAWRKETDA